MASAPQVSRSVVAEKSEGQGVSERWEARSVGVPLEGYMSIISMFYGIIILMFYFDNKRHYLPHIHAQYAEQEAIIAIDDGAVLEGSLSTAKMKLVQAWIEIHRDDLMADWKMAVEGQQPFKIDPLK